MSKKIIIQGSYPLKGAVRLGGAKNASFKLMIASILTQGETRLLNFSKIADVANTKKIISSLGGKIKSCGERTLLIDTSPLKKFTIPKNLGQISRASTMFIGPLISRFKQAIVPLPGGDKIGPRPLERHFAGLKALGVKLKAREGLVCADCSQLVGARFKFAKNTHTGTETLIMTAVLAKGKTILENAAEEPEVDDLINFLNQMGAKIKRKRGRKIEIVGVKSLQPIIYKIMPDRNEAVSYAIAAIVTGGDIVVENAKKEHLEAFLEKLVEAGGGIEVGNYGIRFFYKKPLEAVDIVTQPHPGFMTDWQPLWAVLATQSKGVTAIIESVYLNRFGYVEDLAKMGAKISFFQPVVESPENFYNFNSPAARRIPPESCVLEDEPPPQRSWGSAATNEESPRALGAGGGFNLQNHWEEPFHGIEIEGPGVLSSVNAKITDLRAGATLVLAGLVASGTTVLGGVEHIDRGYEDLDGRLRQLGAKIKRVETE